MQYPLEEKIGIPELLVGRVSEFANFNKWLANIPRKLSKSRVILARRKSGKTVFVQRLFNQLWSENGQVVPFYFDMGENKVWYPDFAVKYFQTFASHYISFLERDPTPVERIWTLEQIKAYGESRSLALLVEDVDALRHDQELGSHGLMWERAYAAPHRYASVYDRRVLVMLDEFQNITQYVYPDPNFATKPIESMAGSFHYHSESKIAPMLVTGSYVGWLLSIISKYLEAGRLTSWFLNPYLQPEEGLEAVYQYAEVYEEPITNLTALQINELCMSDPFFISCVIQSNYAGLDLTTAEGVINTVNYEISDRESEMSRTWAEYISLTLQRINDRNAKKLLLHLNKHSDRFWTPRELKSALQLDLSEYEIQDRLITMSESDLIARGTSDIQFRGLQDGTLDLILRNRFEQEISQFIPDLKEEFQGKLGELQKENRRLRGMLNHLSGRLAEVLLANELRARKRLRLTDYFAGIADAAEWNLLEVRDRVTFQRVDGKGQEIDLFAASDDGRVLLVEVRKRQEKSSRTMVEDFWDKVNAYRHDNPAQIVVPAFLSLGGFTTEAHAFCTQHGIGTAEQIRYTWSES